MALPWHRCCYRCFPTWNWLPRLSGTLLQWALTDSETSTYRSGFQTRVSTPWVAPDTGYSTIQRAIQLHSLFRRERASTYWTRVDRNTFDHFPGVNDWLYYWCSWQRANTDRSLGATVYRDSIRGIPSTSHWELQASQMCDDLYWPAWLSASCGFYKWDPLHGVTGQVLFCDRWLLPRWQLLSRVPFWRLLANGYLLTRDSCSTYASALVDYRGIRLQQSL